MLAGSLLAGCGRPEARRLDVLLVTVDTLRADFVHSYGFAAETTPNLDALARRGVLFETAIAASTATVPSHASIMTSRYVREHSVGPWNGSTRLDGLPTLAESFRAAGYETAAFVSNVVLESRSGLDRGFDLYDDELPAAELNRALYFERGAADTAARALAWLARPRTAPFFLWVHLQDPHGPYTPPEPWKELVPEVPLRTSALLPVLRVNRGRGGLPSYQALPGVRTAARYAGLYAGEIAFTDHWIGELMGACERAAGAAGLVALVTADHGESLDEDGFFFQHGHSTSPEQARVPFVVAAPGLTPRRIQAAQGVVSHVDVAPTLLALAGLAPLDAPSGVSLAPVLRGEAPLPARTVISDVGHELAAWDARGYVTVKVIRPGGSLEPELDPAPAIRAQTIDWQRYERVEPDAGESGAAMPRWRRTGETPLPRDVADYVSRQVPAVLAQAMGEEDLERLRALGYLPPKLSAELPAELAPDLPPDPSPDERPAAPPAEPGS